MNTDKAKHAAAEKNDLVHAVLDEATGRVTDIIDDVKERGDKWVGNLKKRGDALLEDVEERGQNVWKDATRWASKNPGKAIGWSFVAGILLHAYLGRNRD